MTPIFYVDGLPELTPPTKFLIISIPVVLKDDPESVTVSPSTIPQEKQFTQKSVNFNLFSSNGFITIFFF